MWVNRHKLWTQTHSTQCKYTGGRKGTENGRQWRGSGKMTGESKEKGGDETKIVNMMLEL